jgi:predicted nucleic acid-binding Zn ribbon protein
MNTFPATRLCVSCRKSIKGRTDKKFCDDHCRNSYNNHLKNSDTNLVRNINSMLGKNRRILEEILTGGEKVETSNEKLLEKGFMFKYFTHLYNNENGETWYFCYDLAYRPLENDECLIVKNQQ